MSNRFFPNYDGYKITSRFGMRTLNGVTRMHNGIDLVAKTETGASARDYITAHSAGTVYAVGYDSAAGYYVKITVGEALMVYYHLKTMPQLKKGAAVRKGQIIGIMGSTGRSTGAHLHFGIKVNGSWINPEPYLNKDYTGGGKTVKIEVKVLRKGSTGAQVKTAQRLLTAHGHTLDDDGDFGSNTEKAVKAFQKKHGLTDDGIVGAQTWTKLIG